MRIRCGRVGGCEVMWVEREERIEAKGEVEVGAGGGMNENFAVGGMVRRLVRSKEWQNGWGSGKGKGEDVMNASSLGASCRGDVILCAVSLSHGKPVDVHT